ncbi:glycosyl hydrolase family 71-domain-containing protein [Mycena rebaudengoi]|nr:glycosyl hydrolase family 71-domain-containing protein [Mycena rebaudengoi]
MPRWISIILLGLAPFLHAVLVSGTQTSFEVATSPKRGSAVSLPAVANLEIFPDIALASSKGIDAFALNVGRDPWQPSRLADGYAAAKKQGSSFKLFLSFDMGSLPCGAMSDATILRNYNKAYQNHQNQLVYNGRPLASMFAGESCRFGCGSLDEGWNKALKIGQPAIHFIPSFFVDPAAFPSLTVMDGAFNVVSVQTEGSLIHGWDIGITSPISLGLVLVRTPTDLVNIFFRHESHPDGPDWRRGADTDQSVQLRSEGFGSSVRERR